MKTAKKHLQDNWGFTDEDIEKLEKHNNYAPQIELK